MQGTPPMTEPSSSQFLKVMCVDSFAILVSTIPWSRPCWYRFVVWTKKLCFLAQSAEKCPPAIETSNPSQGSFSGGRFGCFFLWYPCMVYLPTFTNSFLAKCMHIYIYHTWILWVLNNRSLCCESWRNMVKHFAYTEVVRDVMWQVVVFVPNLPFEQYAPQDRWTIIIPR